MADRIRKGDEESVGDSTIIPDEVGVDITPELLGAVRILVDGEDVTHRCFAANTRHPGAAPRSGRSGYPAFTGGRVN